MYSLAIFDMAGTTIDDRDEVYRVLRAAAEREGASFSDAEFQRYMGTEKFWAIGQLLNIGGADTSEETHQRAWEWFREELARTYHENPPTPMGDIEQLFATLRGRGLNIALTTGFAREITDLILHAMGWDNGIVDAVAAGDEVPQGRPEPFLIQKVMEDVGVTDPQRVISVGDTQADVESAQKAGVTSVGVLTGHLSREEFNSHGADYVLDGAVDLPSILEG